jgi:hypothetical protein
VTANVLPATRELTDLAVAVRPDFDRTQVEGAISAARSAGWSFPRVLLELVRLLVQDDSSPRDLTAAARDPLARPAAAAPSVNREWAQVCREVIAAARDGAA